MSEFKMVENRKYNNEEIKYVVSRVHAGWDPDTIAKAFKQDHGEYWTNREFTKKQVAYIRTTYKPPPGMVKPYTGPIPVFSRSPTPEDSPEPVSSSSRKRKRAAGIANARSSSTQTPAYGQASSPIAGPSRQGQQANSPMGGPSSASFDPRRFMSPISPTVASASTNNMLGDQSLQDANVFDLTADDLLGGFTYTMDAFERDMASGDLDLDLNSPNMMNPGASTGQDAPIPDLSTLLPEIPMQSIEGNPSTGTNSAFPTPQQQQQEEDAGDLGLEAPQFPPGCSRAGAMARDASGVWYYDPHDLCPIPLGHRHDMDGGVHFISELGVMQALLAMDQKEGIGFLLGVAMTAEQILWDNGNNVDNNNTGNGLGGGGGSSSRIQPEALMRQVTQIVRDNLPPPNDLYAQAPPITVPRPEVMRSMTERIRRLPEGQFPDPFHRRTVRYDMSGSSGAQGGAAGSGGPRHDTSPPGPAPF
ncbi:hypothetical protein Daus18300_004164 [Diaporthe australafricana]|uniref:Clr5 domain-containing protein n=1 Tax=Diaporthe australafricana TaxID=127596 RepID=A0ABR3XAS2_9PEZI